MNDSSELSKLPDWLVITMIGTRVQKPRKIKAPTKEKAREYAEFELRQRTNEPSKVIEVKKV